MSADCLFTKWSSVERHVEGILCAKPKKKDMTFLAGMQVVAKLLESDGEAALSSMTQRFRSAFVDTTAPRFLPPFWKVDHKYARQDFFLCFLYI